MPRRASEPNRRLQGLRSGAVQHQCPGNPAASPGCFGMYTVLAPVLTGRWRRSSATTSRPLSVLRHAFPNHATSESFDRFGRFNAGQRGSADTRALILDQVSADARSAFSIQLRFAGTWIVGGQWIKFSDRFKLETAIYPSRAAHHSHSIHEFTFDLLKSLSLGFWKPEKDEQKS